MPSLKVRVDEHKCVGAGQCARVAPEVFDQRESDGIVMLLAERPSDDLAPYVKQAASLCPAKAIRVEETDFP